MEGHLSHSEIEQIIDEQEREIEQELHADLPEQPLPGASTPLERPAGLPGRLRRFWESLRRKFN